MKLIPVHELEALMAGTTPIDLIDVRTPAEFAEIHVPGARLAPLDTLDCGAIIAEHNKARCGTPLYILCHSGARADKAAKKFAAIGFEDCVVVKGGTTAWAEAGLPVKRGARRVLPLDRQLRIVMGIMVLGGVLLAQFVNPAWVWLSGFVGCGLIFAGLTDVCPMRSLIAVMPWNQNKPETAQEKSSCCVG